MISSIQNPKIKRIRLLQTQTRSRKKEAAFIVEGIRLVEEALQTGQVPELVIYTRDIDSRGEQLVGRFHEKKVVCEEVSQEVLKAASDTETPQGILAVLPLQPLPLPAECDFLMIADEIRDPGNLGTLLRTAQAAGADGLLLTSGTVDPFSPKVVRAGMGAHFRLPILSCSWEEIHQITNNLTIFAADMEGDTRIWDADFTLPLALILGGEAHGLGENSRNLADTWVNIPMSAGSESLNAAAAGAILLFEVLRQRTQSRSS